MIERRSLLKGLKVGDLVYYKIRPEVSRNNSSHAGAQIIDRKRHGLIVKLEKQTAMGFQMVGVLWNDTSEIDTIAENYLHLINET
jgi:hypothetical protein